MSCLICDLDNLVLFVFGFGYCIARNLFGRLFCVFLYEQLFACCIYFCSVEGEVGSGWGSRFWR